MSEAFAPDHVAEFARAQPWRVPSLGEAARTRAGEPAAARGRAEGYAAGLAESRATAQRLSALLDHLARPLADLNADVERALVALTIEMARRLAHLEMDLDPRRVAGVVREAVSALGSAPRELRVHLHPEDLEAVRAAIGDEDGSNWKLIADRELNRGDCRVAAEGAAVDARLDTRQATLASQLLGEDT
jgi:flagellar assembly protein FliH